MHSIAQVLDEISTLLTRRSLPSRINRKIREKVGMTAIKLFRRKRNDKKTQKRKLRTLLGRPRDRDDKTFVPGRKTEESSHKKKKKDKKRLKKPSSY